MSYDWTTYTPDGAIDRSINLGDPSLHPLLEAMRAHELLDEVTPMPEFPPPGATRAAWAAMQDTRSPDPLRIPTFKLIDQNGWHITTEECYLLVHRLGRVREPHVQRLVEFARYAVSKGGFTVS